MPTTTMETVSIKTEKRIDKRCLSCFRNTYLDLFDKFNLTPAERLSFFVFYEQCILSHSDAIPPEFQQILSRKFCEIIGVKDPYKLEKEENNITAEKLYLEWKPLVENSKESFDLALRLSIAGNIMDYGANNNFDIHDTIQKVLNAKFAIDDSALLQQAIQEAKNILYIGDNAGEIVFDKLFIETCFKTKNVTYAVRGAPVLNDVTTEDTDLVNMEEVAQVISNGHDAPSTILNQSSYDFKLKYKSADLIISKGQGNLEGLIAENNTKIFFLLMVKCEVIGELLGVEKGSFVVFNQK